MSRRIQNSNQIGFLWPICIWQVYYAIFKRDYWHELLTEPWTGESSTEWSVQRPIGLCHRCRKNDENLPGSLPSNDQVFGVLLRMRQKRLRMPRRRHGRRLHQGPLYQLPPGRWLDHWRVYYLPWDQSGAAEIKEFRNMEDLQHSQQLTYYRLDDKADGTGFVVRDRKLYYNKRQSREVRYYNYANFLLNTKTSDPESRTKGSKS